MPPCCRCLLALAQTSIWRWTMAPLRRISRRWLGSQKCWVGLSPSLPPSLPLYVRARA